MTARPSVVRSLFFLYLAPWFVAVAAAAARDKPFMEVRRFDANVSQRTNVCGRQKLLYQDNITIARALDGLNLTVAITKYTEPYEDAFFNLDEDGYIPEENPGLFVIVLDELARRAGFHWRDSFVAIDAVDMSNENRNRSQSELLEWQVNNFDISVDNWSKTVSRLRRGIAFPEGWYDSSLVLIERTDPNSEDVDMWSFLTPFQFSVWIMIGVAIVATGLMYWMLERLNTESDEAQLESKPLTTVFLSALTFTGNFNFQPNTHAARLLSLSWTFWALIVVAAYTANLASFLVARRTPDYQIKSVGQAVRYSIPICVHGNSNQDELLTETYSDILLVRKPTERQVFEGLINGDCRVAVAPVNAYELYVRSPINKDCSIKSEKRVIEILSGGLATAIDSGTLCTSLIDNVLDLYMTQMKADNFMDEVWNSHLMKVGDVSCLAEEDIPGTGGLTGSLDSDTVSLTLEEMAGIFILHGMCASLALLIALVRFFLVKKNDPQEMLERLGLTKEDGEGGEETNETGETTVNGGPPIVPSLSISGPNEFWDHERNKQKHSV